MDDPRVIAAIIAAIVSLIASVLGAVITLFNIRQRMTVQSSQIELKKKEIEHIKKDLATEIEGLRQSQFEQVLAKRIELYPKLWAIHIRYETNWLLEKRPKDGAWAREYLKALNEFNLQGGLFFSQDLYSKFSELRNLLYDVVENTDNKTPVNSENIFDVHRAVYGSNGNPGLATYEKDDLGSYRNTYIQRRDSNNV